MAGSSVRRQLALLVARYFYVHLRAELKKPERLLGHITREGVPFRDVTEEMLAVLEAEFPEELSARDLPRVNLFERWWNGMRTAYRYEESTFKLYNKSFLQRIFDLRDGTDERREEFAARLTEMLEHGRYDRRTVTYEVFYAGEGRFYEMLRAAVETAGLPRFSTRLLARQHEFVIRCTHRFFDSALKRSLERTEQLLRTVLPERIAREWQEQGTIKPTYVPVASVLFTDIVGFTRLSEILTPEELLSELDRCFSHFDQIVEQHQLEKLKTIGDAYMCAGGLLETRRQHPLDIALCALRIQEFMRKYRKSRARAGLPVWDLRVGIHVGPVVAGVIGTSRFSYDIWGDTVNLASRMEDAGEPRRINVSQEFKEMTDRLFSFEYRGQLPVKGKGGLDMYFLTGIRPELTVRNRGRVPSRKFREAYGNFGSVTPG